MHISSLENNNINILIIIYNNLINIYYLIVIKKSNLKIKESQIKYEAFNICIQIACFI